MFKKLYNFGGYSDNSGIHVSSKTIFNNQTGYGLLSQKLISTDVGEESILGGGFSPRANECDMRYEEKAFDKDCGVVLDIPRYPLRFKAIVPESGIYRVTLKIKSNGKEIKSLSIYTIRRNLAAHNIYVAPNETYTTSFLVHVCGYMPFASSKVLDENAVYVSVIGEPAVISSIAIEKTDAPTIFVAGDSTLTDQPAKYPYYPKENCGGWAQVLLSFLNGNIAVCNQSHSGLTGTCFRDDGHWNIIKDRITEGDLFLIQFGHNDQKRRNLRADGGYTDNLRWYTNEVRKRGAFPIIVTPLSRSQRKSDGSVNDLLVNYAKACINVGQEMNVPVIDLHEKSLAFVNSINADEAKRYYMNGDVTHTNDFGCMKMALFCADSAVENNIAPLTKYFAPKRPNDFITLYSEEIPQSPAQGKELKAIPLPYVDIADSPDLEWIKKAGEKELLDICVMYLHPSEYLPRAQFVFLLFKALRMSPKSFGVTQYKDVSITDWETDIINTLRDEKIAEQTDFFRPNDNITGGESVSMIVRALHKKAERDLSAEQCLTEAKNIGLLYNGFSAKDFITRGEILRLLVSMIDLSEISDKNMPSSIEIHPIG